MGCDLKSTQRNHELELRPKVGSNQLAMCELNEHVFALVFTEDEKWQKTKFFLEKQKF